MIKKYTLITYIALLSLIYSCSLFSKTESCEVNSNLETKENDRASNIPYKGQVPLKQELLDNLYLVHGANSFNDIILGPKSGTLTIKQHFLSANCDDDYSFAHDGIHRTNNHSCTIYEGPIVYFTPGRLWGMADCPKYVIIIPLKKVYNELISVSMDEILTFNTITLDEDATIITWDDVEVPQHIEESSVSIIRLSRPEEDPSDIRMACKSPAEPSSCKPYSTNKQCNKYIRDAVHTYIRSKSGWPIKYKYSFGLTDYCNDDYCDNHQNGWIEEVEITDSKKFLEAITTETIPFGIAHVPNDAKTSKHQRIVDMKLGSSRNFGFEFFAAFYRMQSFLDWKGAPEEMTKDLIDYFKAYLISWEIFSFENKDSYTNLKEALNIELLKYKNLSLKQTFDLLVKQGNHQFRSIQSCRTAFKLNFLKETIFLQNNEEVFNFIKMYADYLQDNNIELPYPKDQLKDILTEMYMGVQSSENRFESIMNEVFDGDEEKIKDYVLSQENWPSSYIFFYDTLKAIRLIPLPKKFMPNQ